MNIRTALPLAFMMICSLPATAVETVPKNSKSLLAVVEALQDHDLRVKGADGKSFSAALSPEVRVTRQRKAAISDVKAGQFIGCTAVEHADGKLYAEEIHILPEEMRGAGEGHYPWGDMPNTTMTNGAVKQLVGVSDGKVLHVTYKGGQSEIQIPKDVTVTRIDVASVDELKPGVPVTIFLVEDVSGKPVARYISIQAVPIAP